MNVFQNQSFAWIKKSLSFCVALTMLFNVHLSSIAQASSLTPQGTGYVYPVSPVQGDAVQQILAGLDFDHEVNGAQCLGGNGIDVFVNLDGSGDEVVLPTDSNNNYVYPFGEANSTGKSEAVNAFHHLNLMRYDLGRYGFLEKDISCISKLVIVDHNWFVGGEALTLSCEHAKDSVMVYAAYVQAVLSSVLSSPIDPLSVDVKTAYALYFAMQAATEYGGVGEIVQDNSGAGYGINGSGAVDPETTEGLAEMCLIAKALKEVEKNIQANGWLACEARQAVVRGLPYLEGYTALDVVKAYLAPEHNARHHDAIIAGFQTIFEEDLHSLLEEEVEINFSVLAYDSGTDITGETLSVKVGETKKVIVYAKDQYGETYPIGSDAANDEYAWFSYETFHGTVNDGSILVTIQPENASQVSTANVLQFVAGSDTVEESFAIIVDILEGDDVAEAVISITSPEEGETLAGTSPITVSGEGSVVPSRVVVIGQDVYGEEKEYEAHISPTTNGEYTFECHTVTPKLGLSIPQNNVRNAEVDVKAYDASGNEVAFDRVDFFVTIEESSDQATIGEVIVEPVSGDIIYAGDPVNVAGEGTYTGVVPDHVWVQTVDAAITDNGNGTYSFIAENVTGYEQQGTNCGVTILATRGIGERLAYKWVAFTAEERAASLTITAPEYGILIDANTSVTVMGNGVVVPHRVVIDGAGDNDPEATITVGDNGEYTFRCDDVMPILGPTYPQYNVQDALIDVRAYAGDGTQIAFKRVTFQVKLHNEQDLITLGEITVAPSNGDVIYPGDPVTVAGEGTYTWRVPDRITCESVHATITDAGDGTYTFIAENVTGYDVRNGRSCGIKVFADRIPGGHKAYQWVAFTAVEHDITLAITSPENGATVTTTSVSVQGRGSIGGDQQTVASVKVNNVAARVVYASPIGGGTIDTMRFLFDASDVPLLVNNQNTDATITAIAYDIHGNELKRTQVTVTYKEPVPSADVTISSPKVGTVVETNARVTVKGYGTVMPARLVVVGRDGKGNVKEYDALVTRKGGHKYAFRCANVIPTLRRTYPNENYYNAVVGVKAYDTHGDVIASGSVHFKMKKTDRVSLSIVSPENGSKVTTSKVAVRGGGAIEGGRTAVASVKVNNVPARILYATPIGGGTGSLVRFAFNANAVPLVINAKDNRAVITAIAYDVSGKVIARSSVAVLYEKPTPTYATTPLYRFYRSGSLPDHFYTANENEKKQVIARGLYRYEGTSGYVHTKQEPGTVPLYRLYRSNHVDHFYTTSASERDTYIRRHGYRYEGIVGYVHTKQVKDTIPLHRYYHSRLRDHFYTIHNEQNAYKYEGVACYVHKR